MDVQLAGKASGANLSTAKGVSSVVRQLLEVDTGWRAATCRGYWPEWSGPWASEANGMATKPTRMQQQACDHLAQALLLITEAVRLDGKGKLDRAGLGVIAAHMAQASSAFGLDEIVVRALERRGAGLGLPSSAAELLTLLDCELQPLEMLFLADDEFRALVEQMEAELGEV